ncbi:MAG TPA: SCO1664 family protein [Actinomycetes bacterium]|nr:SCO1664 family protein [Actinomycetes bacterium]
MTRTIDDLEGGELEIVGQLVDASNASLFCQLSRKNDDPMPVIYKPRAGERPLWDFPEGTLSRREVAARIVSDSLGWAVVPPTVWREGPFGPGMVQQWVEVDESADVVAMVQSDHPFLQKVAVFDALINNADRKGGHLLPTTDGHIWGIDHGVSFAVENKLRTVLWQWRGEELPEELLSDLRRWTEEWSEDPEWLTRLRDHLSAGELRALKRRAERLIATRRHPEPSPDWPAIPWPPF